MRNASAVLSLLAFFFALIATLVFAPLCIVNAFVAYYTSTDPAMTELGRVLTVIFGILAVLSLVSLVMILIGRIQQGNDIESKKYPKVFLIAGILGLNPFGIVAGVLAIKASNSEN